MKPPIEVDCPACGGRGTILRRYKYRVYTDKERALARKMYQEGATLREIGKKIGVSHPQSVRQIINTATK